MHSTSVNVDERIGEPNNYDFNTRCAFLSALQALPRRQFYRSLFFVQFFFKYMKRGDNQWWITFPFFLLLSSSYS